MATSLFWPVGEVALLALGCAASLVFPGEKVNIQCHVQITVKGLKWQIPCQLAGWEHSLCFSARISRSAPALALEIENPIEGGAFPRANVPLSSVLSPLILRTYLLNPRFYRRFPHISRRYPCFSGFCILAGQTANLQKRQGSCHTLPHIKWRRAAEF